MSQFFLRKRPLFWMVTFTVFSGFTGAQANTWLPLLWVSSSYQSAGASQAKAVDIPPCQNQKSSTIVHGQIDQFSQPGEPTFQGPGIQSLGSGPWANFDYLSPNRQFGHTIQNLPCNIVAATLTISLQSTSSLSRNDNIGLGVTGGTPKFLWARRVKDVLGVPWDRSGDKAVMTLDLTALPLANGQTIDILYLLNSSGELDIYFQDDTAVDYIQLDVTTCLGTDCNKNGISDACEDLPIVLNCPSEITKSLSPEPGNCCQELSLNPTATDICGNSKSVVITNDYNDAVGGFSDCFPLGTTTVRFTATDDRGNTVTCTTTVTIRDTTPPTILFCPEQ